ncbi:MAG TPA: TetR/AcrR family transcriptional regulator [Acidimicrobiales bacterium]|jgi:AcrR family transcriptional regulator|nr:TetR/AcrR family transcriptional regulator [Acidimicrobiales bacterium]
MTKGLETASRRELRRERHQDLSRTQLLDAAERVFGEKGFHDATLNEIAELAEYSVGSVYSFFAGKEDLFSQVFVRRGEEFMPAMRDIVEGTGSPTDKLHRLVDFQVGFFRDHRRFARLFLRYVNVALVSEPSELDASIAGNYDESMRLQTELISRGQRSGEFHPGDPEVLAHLFSGLIASYQALDPSVVSDEPDPVERLSLVDLHQMVGRAFEA